jgi:hypothetical protein
MSSPYTISIVTSPSNDRAVIIAAIIGFVATIILAVITAFATLLGAVITVVATWQQKAIECCWIPKDDWRRIARENGWIPRGECPWQTIITTGQDTKGNKVTVQIKLLSGEYRWVFKSSTMAELGEEKTDLRLQIRGLDLDPKATAIVAVGMASVEGDFASQSVLAEERTDWLISLIREELKPRIPVHGLSLGRFIDETTRSDTKATAVQRRVIVIAVFEPEGVTVNLEEAVPDALISATNASPPIPFDVRDYKDRKYTDHSFGR